MGAFDLTKFWGPTVRILTKHSSEKSNAPHMPGVSPLGLNIDRCITAIVGWIWMYRLQCHTAGKKEAIVIKLCQCLFSYDEDNESEIFEIVAKRC